MHKFIEEYLEVESGFHQAIIDKMSDMEIVIDHYAARWNIDEPALMRSMVVQLVQSAALQVENVMSKDQFAELCGAIYEDIVEDHEFGRAAHLRLVEPDPK